MAILMTADRRQRVHCDRCGAIFICNVLGATCDRCTYSDPKYRRMVILNRLEDVAIERARAAERARKRRQRTPPVVLADLLAISRYAAQRWLSEEVAQTAEQLTERIHKRVYLFPMIRG